nr:InfA [Melastoma dodecandrum]WCA44285.1 InfA [Melastoma dodecandrum]
MVILLIFELSPELTIWQKKKRRVNYS